MLPLLDTYMPDQFVYFIREFQFAMLDFSFMDFMTIKPLKRQVLKLDYDQPHDYLIESDIMSGSHMVNQFNNLQVLLVFIMTNLLLLILFIALNT